MANKVEGPRPIADKWGVAVVIAELPAEAVEAALVIECQNGREEAIHIPGSLEEVRRALWAALEKVDGWIAEGHK